MAGWYSYSNSSKTAYLIDHGVDRGIVFKSWGSTFRADFFDDPNVTRYFKDIEKAKYWVEKRYQLHILKNL